MMMAVPTYAETKRLFDSGMTKKAIAQKFGCSAFSVAAVLNPGIRLVYRENERRKGRSSSERNLPQTTKRKIAPPDVKREAILAFHRHEIDRAELMRRITL